MKSVKTAGHDQPRKQGVVVIFHPHRPDRFSGAPRELQASAPNELKLSQDTEPALISTIPFRPKGRLSGPRGTAGATNLTGGSVCVTQCAGLISPQKPNPGHRFLQNYFGRLLCSDGPILP